MAQYQVPQFIDTEDKIIGPFTLKQFIYLAIAGGISALSFLIFEKIIAFVITAALMGLAALLAFVKMNGRPMSYYLSAAFKFFWTPNVYVFKTEGLSGTVKTKDEAFSVSHNSLSGIKELSEKLATSKEAIPKRELAMPPGTKDPSQSEKEQRFEIVKEITGAREAARRIDYR